MEVKHFIACAETVRILPVEPPSRLLHDVRYSYITEPGEDRSLIIEKICLFTRFYGATGSHEFALKVSWQDANDESRILREEMSIPLEFNPAQFVVDHVFAIYEVLVPSPGLLEIELTCEDEPEIILAVEYLEVREP